MNSLAVATVKIKALIVLLSLLVLGGAIYEMSSGEPAINTVTSSQSPYSADIQERTQLVENAVLGVVDAQGKQDSWEYRTTCEKAVSFIRQQNLETDRTTTLSPEERQVNEEFKAYLHEAYIVVDDCFNGKQADLTTMNEAKDKLF